MSVANGINFPEGTQEDLTKAEPFYKDMSVFPQEGSIVLYEGVIYVKIGDA